MDAIQTDRVPGCNCVEARRVLEVVDGQAGITVNGLPTDESEVGAWEGVAEAVRSRSAAGSKLRSGDRPLLPLLGAITIVLTSDPGTPFMSVFATAALHRLRSRRDAP